MSFTTDATIKTFGGKLLKLSHESKTTNSKMAVNVFLPPQYETGKKIPVLMYLSGLTCTPANVTEKGFWYPWASKYGFALVFPDTSPRDVSINDDSWYVGTGAGFYIDAETPEWSNNYQMYSYVDKELPTLLAKEFTDLDFEENFSITGHSMGGYGAILHFLTSSKNYKSCSAFSPLSNIYQNTWTELAFAKYLGDDRSKWSKYDLSQILSNYSKDIKSTIKIHVGLADSFYDELKCKSLVENSKNTKLEGKIELNEVEGYDHSYFFISSFVEEHAKHHLKYLGLL